MFVVWWKAIRRTLSLHIKETEDINFQIPEDEIANEFRKGIDLLLHSKGLDGEESTEEDVKGLLLNIEKICGPRYYGGFLKELISSIHVYTKIESINNVENSNALRHYNEYISGNLFI